MVACNMHIM